MTQKVKFGLTLSNRGVLLGLTQPEEILEMAELAESSGAFDHVWVGDSIMAKPRMESITLMSGIAADMGLIAIITLIVFAGITGLRIGSAAFCGGLSSGSLAAGLEQGRVHERGLFDDVTPLFKLGIE